MGMVPWRMAHTGRVLSIDLAYRDYRDIGIVVLEAAGCGVEVAFRQIRASGRPTPDTTAQRILDLAEETGAEVLLLDGPQGWKDPASPYPHSRVCERILNTPAKTGLPGQVKPANYAPFVEFSIAVFDRLQALGWPRYRGTEGTAHHTSVESFPLSAWRSLGLKILPAKQKATGQDIDQRLETLAGQFNLRMPGVPNHDELQAIVSGLAGLALLRGDAEGVRLEGVAPFELEGTMREGYIVNPRLLSAPTR